MYEVVSDFAYIVIGLRIRFWHWTRDLLTNVLVNFVEKELQ